MKTLISLTKKLNKDDRKKAKKEEKKRAPKYVLNATNRTPLTLKFVNSIRDKIIKGLDSEELKKSVETINKLSLGLSKYVKKNVATLNTG